MKRKRFFDVSSSKDGGEIQVVFRGGVSADSSKEFCAELKRFVLRSRVKAFRFNFVHVGWVDLNFISLLKELSLRKSIVFCKVNPKVRSVLGCWFSHKLFYNCGK